MKKDTLDTINEGHLGYMGRLVNEQYLNKVGDEEMIRKTARELSKTSGVNEEVTENMFELYRSLTYPFGKNDFGPCILPKELYMPGYKGEELEEGESSSKSPCGPNGRNTGDDDGR